MLVLLAGPNMCDPQDASQATVPIEIFRTISIGSVGCSVQLSHQRSAPPPTSQHCAVICGAVAVLCEVGHRFGSCILSLLVIQIGFRKLHTRDDGTDVRSEHEHPAPGARLSSA